ncbi:hypothetical protein EDD18DRAFT_1020097, partial [Armillaria luteobubalina]
MRLLILGGTGPSGILLIRQVLTTVPSPFVVVYARNPSKLPTDLSSNSSVQIIEGQLDDAEKLSQAMEAVDAVLSALGPAQNHPADKPLTRGYTTIIQVMHEHKVNRLIVLGTASISDPNDRFSIPFYLMVSTVKTIAHTAYEDIVAFGDLIRAQDDLDWTIVRVPVLRDGEKTDVQAGYIGQVG